MSIDTYTFGFVYQLVKSWWWYRVTSVPQRPMNSLHSPKETKVPPWYNSRPPTSYTWGYNSTFRGYNPSYPSIRPFIGVITPFITSRGPPCIIVPLSQPSSNFWCFQNTLFSLAKIKHLWGGLFAQSHWVFLFSLKLLARDAWLSTRICMEELWSLMR